jgi:hypothetical protein
MPRATLLFLTFAKWVLWIAAWPPAFIVAASFGQLLRDDPLDRPQAFRTEFKGIGQKWKGQLAILTRRGGSNGAIGEGAYSREGFG